MPDSIPAPPAAELKDRHGWLVFFGVVEILLGAFSALAAAGLMVVLLFGDRIPGLQADGLLKLGRLLGMAMYSVAAMIFISAGIGTWRGRRWARILMLVVSSVWLAFGVLGSLFFLMLLPMIRKQAASGAGNLPAGTMNLVLGLAVGMAILFQVALPGTFLLFYTRRSVRATFLRKDVSRPPVRKCPIPVMIAVVWIAVGAAGSLLSAPFGVQFVFGAILKGLPAVLLCLALAAVQAWLSRGLYRLERRAWRGTLAFKGLVYVSAVVTFLRIPFGRILQETWSWMTLPEQTQTVLEGMQRLMPLQTALTGAACLAFVLYLGKYFRAAAPAVSGEPASGSRSDPPSGSGSSYPPAEGDS